MTFGVFWDEPGTPTFVSTGTHTMLGLAEPVFPLGLAQWEGWWQGYLALLTITVCPNSPSAPPMRPSQLPVQAMLTPLCPVLPNLQHLVPPHHPLANCSPLLHIKGGGSSRIRAQNNACEISACFWIIQGWEAGLEMVPLEANSSCFFFLPFFFFPGVGMLLHGMVVFKYRFGTLSQKSRPSDKSWRFA